MSVGYIFTIVLMGFCYFLVALVISVQVHQFVSYIKKEVQRNLKHAILYFLAKYKLILLT